MYCVFLGLKVGILNWQQSSHLYTGRWSYPSKKTSPKHIFLKFVRPK
jgi:hypothetical protein